MRTKSLYELEKFYSINKRTNARTNEKNATSWSKVNNNIKLIYGNVLDELWYSFESEMRLHIPLINECCSLCAKYLDELYAHTSTRSFGWLAIDSFTGAGGMRRD